jgi:MoxR-like ATPase
MENSVCELLHQEISRVIIGKDFEIRVALSTIISGGNLLIEDVPGTGKTLLGKTLASIIGGNFQRIQCTPELIPSDIIGTNVFNRATNQFEFHCGPLFSNILLCDELNRASPRTQSALLEAMEEKHVSVVGKQYALPEFFTVIATQNPIDRLSTFDLPHSQLDRFAAQISLGFPAKEVVIDILKDLAVNTAQPTQIIELSTFQELQALAPTIFIDDKVIGYIVELCYELRKKDSVISGPSTRAIKSFCNLLKAWALVNNRGYVIPDDVKTLFVIALKHRVIFDTADHLHDTTSGDGDVFMEVLDEVSEPKKWKDG